MFPQKRRLIWIFPAVALNERNYPAVIDCPKIGDLLMDTILHKGVREVWHLPIFLEELYDTARC